MVTERWYRSDVVADRSYCAEVARGDAETNEADPVLTVFRKDATTQIGTDDDTLVEPRLGLGARCAS